MAAMSLRQRATARAPIFSAPSSRVKCTPSMLRSALRSRSRPVGEGITAQSSPISGERRCSFAIMLSSVTMRGSQCRGYQSGWQLFAEHFTEILFRFAFQRGPKRFRNPFANHLDGGRAQIAGGIARAPRDGNYGILRFRDFEE